MGVAVTISSEVRAERLGISVPVEQVSLQNLSPLVAEAETWGYTDAWSGEVGGTDAFTPLACIASATRTMRLGTAVASVFTRPPALLAMTAATMQAASGGRFCLGLGTSSRMIVNDWMGAPFERPLARVRDHLSLIPRLLSGSKLDFRGETVEVKGFRLQMDTVPHTPLFLAALGPRMFRTAGAMADGVIVNFVSPRALPGLLEHAYDASRSAGRDPKRLEVIGRIWVAVDQDEELVTRYLSRHLAAYCTVDIYRRFLARQGFQREVEKINEAWHSGNRCRAVELVPGEMLRELFVFGNGTTCRAALEEFRRSGVTTPVLSPIVFGSEPLQGVRRTLKALSPLSEQSLAERCDDGEA